MYTTVTQVCCYIYIVWLCLISSREFTQHINNSERPLNNGGTDLLHPDFTFSVS